MFEIHFLVTHTETEQRLLLVSDDNNDFYLTSVGDVRNNEKKYTVLFENPKNLDLFKSNKLFSHYKGSTYKVFFEAKHLNSNEIFVIYSSDEYEEQGIYWARPKEMFYGYLESSNILRFTPVE